MPTFDIVSKIDLQEIDNAVNQTRKEMEQRYDLKGSRSEVTLDTKENVIKLESSDEMKLKAVLDVLNTKVVKRGISILALQNGKIEPAGGQRVRMAIKMVQGIEKEKAKEVVAMIKKLGSKVQAQIMDEQVRVSGKNRDDLQSVIQALRGDESMGIPLQFINFRD